MIEKDASFTLSLGLEGFYSCPICNKKFNLTRNFARHLLIHENVRDFECDTCQRKFICKSDLNKHSRKHLSQSSNHQKMSKEGLINIEQEIKVEPIEFQLCSANIKLEGGDETNLFTENDTFEIIVDSSCDDNSWTDFQNESISLNNYIKKVSPDSNKNHRFNSIIPLEKDGKKLQVTCRVCCATFNAINDYEDHFLSSHIDEKAEHHCTACNLSFDDRKTLQAHFRETHENFKCKSCRRQFSSQFLLDEHKIEHTLKDPLVCTHCGKLYANRISLNAHTDSQHSNKRFNCDMCNKSYSFKAALYKHRKWVHLEGKKHKCPECKYTARTKYEVKLHYGHHHNANANKKYYCNVCGITFRNASTLTRHTVIQHNGLSFTMNKKCVFCKEPMKNNYQAVKHMAQVHLHGQRKMRNCGFCKVEIELFDDYIEHISSHTGVFICQICGDPFSDDATLQNHLFLHKQLEKELRQYECDYCGQRKSNRAQMESHLISHHAKFPKLHNCKICGKNFKLASVLYTHLKYHNGGSKDCSYCDKKFVTNTDLANHVRINHTHEKPFK